jgi:hypothetical protein
MGTQQQKSPTYKKLKKYLFWLEGGQQGQDGANFIGTFFDLVH